MIEISPSALIAQINQTALMGLALLAAYICSFFGMYLAYRAYKRRGQDGGD